MVGKTLSQFRLTARLGAGGMGEVYLAEDTRLKRKVAIKVLPEEMADDPQRLERFQREAEAIAALNHPNIVAIHEVGEADAVHFLVMELVEGQQLGEVIPGGGLTLDKLFGYAIPLADALAAAHDKGILHRDLKPGNVMVNEEGRVKVLDFGLAKLRERADKEGDQTHLATDSITQEGLILGTAAYMSPEQAEGKTIDHRSDIFSLGVVLYEMATGKRPFKGDTNLSLLSSILKDKPQPVSEVKTGLPRHLGRIILRCLEKDPERRPQSAKDVRNELEGLKGEVVSGEIVTGPTTTAPTPTAGKKMGLIAAGVALAVVALVVAFLLSRPPSTTPVEPGRPQIRSLAVLPLDNLTGDPEQEFFVDGMTEALITDLSKIGSLKVISRTSIMQYKDVQKPLPEIGRELNVDGIVEGSVQRAGDRVRISAGGGGHRPTRLGRKLRAQRRRYLRPAKRGGQGHRRRDPGHPQPGGGNTADHHPPDRSGRSRGLPQGSVLLEQARVGGRPTGARALPTGPRDRSELRHGLGGGGRLPHHRLG
jgi:serine/threonine protein kinase